MFGRHINSKLFFILSSNRLFSTTKYLNKKEIKISTDANVTTVEGVLMPSERKGNVVCLDGLGDSRDTDPISRLGLNVTHTDVRILSQFLRPDGSILPRSVTGVSQRSHYHIEMMIERSRRAGLLPIRIDPDGTHVYYDGGRNVYNVYYDSSIIGIPKMEKLKKPYEIPD